MFRLSKTFTFEASHQLPLHDGKCARLHGHSWLATLIVEGSELVANGPKMGMLVDYGDLSKAVEDLRNNYLDHWHLNDSLAPFLKGSPPTSEKIAELIYWWLIDRLPGLVAVRVRETCTAACEYYPTKENP